MNKAYENEYWLLSKAQQKKMRKYLSGLFTSYYKENFMLHFYCPLCGDQLNVTKHIGFDNPIHFDTDVGMKMFIEMRSLLAQHYDKECGNDRERREKVAQILIAKLQDKVYE